MQSVGIERFSPATRAWFERAFAGPTLAQEQAWTAISERQNTLVIAPTGSGKTLAAFLWALDELFTQPRPAEPAQRCRVVYVSPLKALAVDIDRNLRAPLAGIQQATHALGLSAREITVAMRTGDTPAADRQAFARHPTDILITTPESLFLILTSAAREALRGVQTVIIDEVHAVAGTKRGSHLALSLERLDALLPQPAQRIGLSATVRPTTEVARFLGGAAPVQIVAPPTAKTVEVSVTVPVPDMTELSAAPARRAKRGSAQQAVPSIWPAVEAEIYDLITTHRSTIVFVNSRRVAERLCARLNELAFEQSKERLPQWRVDGAGSSLTARSQPVSIAGVTGRTPAELMAQSGTAHGAPIMIARAHHGSVSHEERLEIEEALKNGILPAVIATSSLELGIDMGAVDLVIQVQAPPSVAAGLQRIGRAGHHVGAISYGVVFPQHRADLLQCAVTAERIHNGQIEALHYPRNPLDVLAQQIAAMVAVEPWHREELATVIRCAAPYANLPDSALEAVLDMLSGRYPSDDFAELRPRLVWDRSTDMLSARSGTQRVVVTAGGTIPDRGLYGVYLASSMGESAGRRVGELDEEMVYESRAGDIFLLGSSSWRIEEITPDRVLVTPAPGQAARMPFWKGDMVGRPAELGRAIGAFAREMSTLDTDVARQRAQEAGLDEMACDNMLAYLAAQQEATRVVPNDQTIVVERFRDEVGDWRIAIHSLLGAPVNGAWALAIAARLRERYPVDVQALHTDDGIIVRLPDMGEYENPFDISWAIFSPEEIEDVVTAELGNSAVFAARFRECAARALLIPRRRPGRRMPLWQQRQRAAQLLAVANQFGSFPIVMEAMRECLQDIYDIAALRDLMREINSGITTIAEVVTPTPSPFARGLVFSYVGAYLYGDDMPLAERRAAALTVDATMLAELLGSAELRELLDADVIARTEAELQWLPSEQHPRSMDEVTDLLRIVGPLSTVQTEMRGAQHEWLQQLAAEHRVLSIRLGESDVWIAVEDAGRLRDVLGVTLPGDIPSAFSEPVAHPLSDLIARYARTHGPFTVPECMQALALPATATSDVQAILAEQAAVGKVVQGEFRPTGSGPEWCDVNVLRTLRRRSLAALRKEIEPVPARAYASFTQRWQRVQGAKKPSSGPDSLLTVIEQLQGIALPASAWESLILPTRLHGYQPAHLDALTSAGEVTWAGAGQLSATDGWIVLALADAAPTLLPAAADPPEDELTKAILAALDGGALFFRNLADTVATTFGEIVPDGQLVTALWDLVWAGHVTNDTLAPLRATLGRGSTRHSLRRRPGAFRLRRPGRLEFGSALGLPTSAGRWSRTPSRETDATKRAHALATTLCARYGVLLRGTTIAESLPGGFAGIYPVLSALEESGQLRRGYFVEGQGGSQFALPGAVDQLRAAAKERDRAGESERLSKADAIVLAATDPANPYGAALPWPVSTGDLGHMPARRAGALVVCRDGELLAYLERGGRSLLTFSNDSDTPVIARALARAVHDGGVHMLTIERIDGAPITGTPMESALREAGFRITPRGLRLRLAESPPPNYGR